MSTKKEKRLSFQIKLILLLFISFMCTLFAFAISENGFPLVLMFFLAAEIFWFNSKHIVTGI